MKNRISLIAATLLVAGCGSSGTIVDERIVTVDRPVPQPCAAERPAQVSSLKSDFPDQVWSGMDVRQKAAAVGRKGLERQGYGEKLDAATGACP